MGAAHAVDCRDCKGVQVTKYIIVKRIREGEAGAVVRLPYRRAEALLKSGHVRLYDWTQNMVAK